MSNLHIETLDRRNIIDTDARAIAELLVRVWPRPEKTVETRTADLMNYWKDYRGPEAEFPRALVIRENGRVIAHAAALPRTIGTSAGDITIMALAQVCSDPDLRGRGLGDAVVRAAFDTVDHGPFTQSLFQTSYKVQPFYEKLGACLVTNRIVNSLGEDPAKNPFWDEIVMRYPAAKPWPTGDIDLRGPGY
ncbi:MAG TPA: GNAT family N-acetyltransferase [Lacipirellulaceae bacterium]